MTRRRRRSTFRRRGGRAPSSVDSSSGGGRAFVLPALPPLPDELVAEASARALGEALRRVVQAAAQTMAQLSADLHEVSRAVAAQANTFVPRDVEVAVLGFDPVAPRSSTRLHLLPGPATFACSACGGTFPKARSDEEALVESQAVFGDHAPADLAVVCDDCYREIMDQPQPTAACRKAGE